MKTAISLPAPLLHAADELAGRLGVSRSELFRRAMETLLREHDHEGVTDALNRVYTHETSQLAPSLARMQASSLLREEW